VRRELDKIKNEKYGGYGELSEFCDIHTNEKIRFFCRDCLEGLCAEDVVHHARHDFILGDNKAAVQIRKTIQVVHEGIREQTGSYNSVLWATEKKLAEIEIYKQQEFKRLSMAFQEIREALFIREKQIKRELHDKIRHAIQSLTDDAHVLQRIMKDLCVFSESAGMVRDAV